jgi:hypothetical protein
MNKCQTIQVHEKPGMVVDTMTKEAKQEDRDYKISQDINQESVSKKIL